MWITCCLQLPAEDATVPWVRSFVTTHLADLGVDGSSIEDIAIALTEACANVVAHAVGDRDDDGDSDFEVEISLGADRCELRITDRGPGFDLDLTEVGPMPGWDAEGGRGIAMIRAVVDDVTWRSRRGGGTTVRITKHLSVLGPFASMPTRALVDELQPAGGPVPAGPPGLRNASMSRRSAGGGSAARAASKLAAAAPSSPSRRSTSPR